MSSFTRLIRFVSSSDSKAYFANVENSSGTIPAPGTEVQAYTSFEDLKAGSGAQNITIGKLLAPVPDPDLPVYCVGLNYRDHAAEVKMNLTKYPPLWTKPKPLLAAPDEDIPITSSVQKAFWTVSRQGELVFVTSQKCGDITTAEAESYILGYTAGNDLSCRALQNPSAAGGQIFYAKAFDNFAPMGPTLLSAAEFNKLGDAVKLTTKVNGEQLQDAECPKDFVFKPAEVLSHMSQGTTIPAYTAVMTGTPAGTGVFRNGGSFDLSGGTFLKDGDVIEIELGGFGVLRNKVVFE